MNDKEELIEQALRLPTSIIPYYVNRQLTELFPDKAVVESQSGLFDVEDMRGMSNAASSHAPTFTANSSPNGRSRTKMKIKVSHQKDSFLKTRATPG